MDQTKHVSFYLHEMYQVHPSCHCHQNCQTYTIVSSNASVLNIYSFILEWQLCQFRLNKIYFLKHRKKKNGNASPVYFKKWLNCAVIERWWNLCCKTTGKNEQHRSSNSFKLNVFGTFVELYKTQTSSFYIQIYMFKQRQLHFINSKKRLIVIILILIQHQQWV